MLNVVVGLPQSGINMTMLMLKRGGADILYNKNKYYPKGTKNNFYYDKSFTPNNYKDWMYKCDGKCLKMSCYWLPYIPNDIEAKFLVIYRNLEYMARSWKYHTNSNDSISKVVKYFDCAATEMMEVINARNATHVTTNYDEIIKNPRKASFYISELFNEYKLDIFKMAKVVKPHRNRYQWNHDKIL